MKVAKSADPERNGVSISSSIYSEINKLEI